MRSGGGASGAHVLVITWSFPPVDSAESRRALTVANAMAEVGATVTVLTDDSPAAAAVHGTDPALARLVAPGIDVLTIADDHPDQLQRIDSWPRERAADPARWREDWLAAASAQFDEPGFGHALAAFVDRGEQLHQQRPVDLVVAVAAPIVVVAAAGELGERCGSDVVVDFARITREQLAAGDDRVGSALHAARALWSADVATRESVRSVFATAADRVEVVPEVAPYPIDVAPRAPTGRSGPLQVGCFVESDAWTSLVDVLSGWIEARRDVPELAEATLVVRGRIPGHPAGLRLALAQAAEHGVAFEPPESLERMAEVYTDLDLVIAVSVGDLPAGRTIDHLGAGRVVVWCTALAPGADHPLARSAHVVRPATLRAGAIRDALAAAARTDVTHIAASDEVSPWPGAATSLLADLEREAGR